MKFVQFRAFRPMPPATSTAMWDRRAAFCVALTVTLCVGCQTTSPPREPGSSASATPTVATPSLGFFSKIKVPDDRVAVLKLSARGAQVFRCEKQDGRNVWAFRQPDSELLDGTGKAVGRHGANFSFEHADGSRLVATISAYDEAPRTTDLRWLLMTTRSFGAGALEGVTHVQRVNTSGGMPPTSCEAGQLGKLLRVDFTSDFVFYRPRSAAAS
jgi:hypothetical protein